MTERLTVVSGCMFAGKTDELIRLVERQEFAGRKVQIFKPKLDNRWGKSEKVRSHNDREKEAFPVEKPEEIISLLNEKTEVVAIDEIQFFGSRIIPVIDKLLDNNKKVLVAGLPLDFRGEPFGSMPVLLAKADEVITVTAICTYSEDGKICGNEATRTQRLVNGMPANYHDEIVVIGAAEAYAPRCPNHHIVPGKLTRRINK